MQEPEGAPAGVGENGPPGVPPDTLARFRRWAAIALAIAVLGYMGYAVFRGFHETAEELASFRWLVYIAVLLLTAANYMLRYYKWHWLLKRLDVDMPPVANVWVFIAGLAMVISPGKAGELLKPYLVRVISGAPMTRTVPALVAERGTDAIAVVILAAIGVSTYYPEKTWVVVTSLAVCIGLLLVIAIEPLALGAIALIRRLPRIGHAVADRLQASYVSMRICTSPWALTVTMALSIAAWFMECLGYWMIFQGMRVQVPLPAATFLYAFATVFGAPSPGGMGMADAALVEGALQIVPGLTGGQALAAALLQRVATLWFGVLLGGLALLRMDAVITRWGPQVDTKDTGATVL